MHDNRDSFRFKSGRVSYIRLEDYYYPLINISENGFLAEIKNNILEQGSLVEIEIVINDPCGSGSFTTTTEIVRSKKGLVAGKWTLNEKQAKNIHEYFENSYKKVA